ncbi:MAG: phosphoribosylformylglycinamidine synthase [Lachnospirales bacterium]
MNRRIFVRKKEGFRTVENSFLNDFTTNLKINTLKTLEYYVVYDILNLDEETFNKSKKLIFSEVNVDEVYENVDFKNKSYFSVTPLPEQFNQRASSAVECIKLLNEKATPSVTSSELFIFNDISENELNKIKKYYINDIESKEKDFNIFEEKAKDITITEDIIEGFINLDKEEVIASAKELGLAFDKDNLTYVQEYFKSIKRNPTMAEVKVIDTYWSDHCRHSTFNTPLVNITFDDEKIEETFNEYLQIRGNKEKPITLMDMGTAFGKYARKNGFLNDLEDTDENNACSIEVEIEVDGKKEVWLHQFKNETHNHPTEIEPFGGAATCLGGAIRDPLSGRAFVFQGMRVSGGGDINNPLDETLKGKLPQRLISKKSAQGFSSYGNQIGLATTYIDELTHPSYVAKRLEAGAVVGAVKKENVLREQPVKGDIVVLLGGKTGKDGIGGATGSSKTLDESSIKNLGGEVQKGNAIEERKLQRLFRNEKFSKVVKKSNDFGAGGVSVAIGELSTSIQIYLDRIKLKDTSLKPYEIAISESQERMAVVIESTYFDLVKKLAEEENLEATYVADITDNNRLVMLYNDLTIVDIDSDFLETNGVLNEQKVVVKSSEVKNNFFDRDINGSSLKEKFVNNLKTHNVASKQGMEDLFDFSVLGTTILAPYGGRYQLTKSQSSVQKFPVEGYTDAVSAIAVGFNPYLSEKNAYLGSMYGSIEALSKLVANGVDYKKIRFSLQEYFERLGTNEEKWGKVVSALMGTFEVQKSFKLPAIGGKDSMSGTFEDINVVPTLLSFAFTNEIGENIISNEFKKVDNYIYLLKHMYNEDFTFNYDNLKLNYDNLLKNMRCKKVVSSYAISHGGLGEALCKMSFGNKLGFEVETKENLFNLMYGSFVIESTEELEFENLEYLGKVSKNINVNGVAFDINDLINAYKGVNIEIYPMNNLVKQEEIIINENFVENKPKYKENVEEVKVFLPVFPGTNSEFDTKRVFKDAGCSVETFIFNNQNPNLILNSIDNMVKGIENSHIFVLAGGFSGGDEPDGSGKFILNVLNNPKIKKALKEFLQEGKLILGICNGFQALIKAGLVTYGEVRALDESSPTLFTNDINRHISRFIGTKVITNRSPWTMELDKNKRYIQAVSHGEGKFFATYDTLKELIKNNQVAFVYTDDDNKNAINNEYNVNGSIAGIEGIISPCGQVLGKMAHCERYEKGLYKNMEANLNDNETLWLDIFSSAVKYFKN